MKFALLAGIGLLALAACSEPTPTPPTAETAPAATPSARSAATPNPMATIEPVPPTTSITPQPGATPNPPPPPQSDRPKLAVEGEGLRWFLPPNGSARLIPFGRPEAEVLASLERVRGEAGKGDSPGCGSGRQRYANWADGLGLTFQGGRFVGWTLDGRAAGALGTADNIGPGTTRATLEAAFGVPVVVRQTSLGTEWTAGAISGLLDGPGPRARITTMWAGTTCIAR